MTPSQAQALTRGVRRSSAAIAGVGIGAGLDGLGVFDGSPSMPAGLLGLVLFTLGVIGFTWAIRR